MTDAEFEQLIRNAQQSMDALLRGVRAQNKSLIRIARANIAAYVLIVENDTLRSKKP